MAQFVTREGERTNECGIMHTPLVEIMGRRDG